MGRYSDYIALLSKVLVGLTFIASALLKCNSIDEFELYIFSLNLFSLNLSALVARLVIGAEIVMGVGYMANIYHKQLYYTLLAALVGFTLFLTYLLVVGNEDNCHCFGDLVDMSPLESIAKNVVIIALLYLSRNTPRWDSLVGQFCDTSLFERNKRYLLFAICLLVAIPFVRYPHHSMFFGRGTSVKGVNREINVELFNSFLELNPQLKWGEECKILAFYGTHCKHCKLSAKMLAQIVKRNDLPLDAIHLLFWGNDEGVETFLSEANAESLDYSLIHPKVLLEITNGEIPTLLLYDDEMEHKFIIHSVRTIDESDMVTRLLKRY